MFPRLQIARATRAFAFLFVVVTLSGCATYQLKAGKARRMLANGNAVGAVAALEKQANTEGKDQLVYLLDFATAAQLAGDYDRSTRAFLGADQMAEVKDYHSISKQTASLLFNQGQVQYKGDDYEKVLINAYLAINYLLMDNLESALVETRRINEKLTHYEVDAKKNYEQNPFAFYLSAMIWESDRNWDSAYIDYHKAYKLNPNIPYLKQDLVRAAYNARRMGTEKKWKTQFGLSRPDDPTFRKHGELVVIYQQGWGPRKRPNPSWHRVPKLFPTPTYTRQAKVSIEGVGEELSQKVYSVQDVAIKTLDDQYAGLIAKRMAGIAAKEVVADQVRQQNETLGALLKIGMHISDQADLRQWSTLPESFHVARIRLKPGEYKIKISGLNGAGVSTGESSREATIAIKRGKKTFLTWRSFH